MDTATKDRFRAWWKSSAMGRPLLRLKGIKDTPGPLVPLRRPQDLCDRYTAADLHINATLNDIARHEYMAEAFPMLSINIGPGSYAVYLGSEPKFAEDTVWFEPCREDWSEPIVFDPRNQWFRTHMWEIGKAQGAANGRYVTAIPDIVENLDILAAMRGPEAFCWDLIDDGERVMERLNELDDQYFAVYDAFYNLIKQKDGSSQYTAFEVWGDGRTAKVQCDFCALMSPAQFERFAVPSLTRQCDTLDNSLYHLDGKDAIRHLDALMSIESLNAIQWQPGAGQPDGGDSKWFELYDRVRTAGKALHITLCDGTPDDMLRAADRVYDRVGANGLYLLFSEMPMKDAERVMNRAETHWKA